MSVMDYANAIASIESAGSGDYAALGLAICMVTIGGEMKREKY